MDGKDFERLQLHTPEAAHSEEFDEYMDCLRYYVETGEPFAAQFELDRDYCNFVNVLGIKDVDGEKISKVHYQDISIESAEPIEEQLTFIGPLGIKTMLSYLGSRYSGNPDRQTGYISGAIIDLDDRTSIAAGCRIGAGSNSYSGSGSRYWLIVMDKEDVGKVDWSTGEVYEAV